MLQPICYIVSDSIRQIRTKHLVYIGNSVFYYACSNGYWFRFFRLRCRLLRFDFSQCTKILQYILSPETNWLTHWALNFPHEQKLDLMIFNGCLKNNFVIFSDRRHCITPCPVRDVGVTQFIPIMSQIAKFMGPTWGPPGSCRPQMGPMLAQWSMISGRLIYPYLHRYIWPVLEATV